MSKRVKANTNWNPWVREPDLPENLRTTRVCLHPRQVVETVEGVPHQRCLRCGHTVPVEVEK